MPTAPDTSEAPPDEVADDPIGDDAIFLTVQEAADLLRISRRHLYELIAEGTVRAVRLGRCTRVPRSVIEELAAA